MCFSAADRPARGETLCLGCWDCRVGLAFPPILAYLTGKA